MFLLAGGLLFYGLNHLPMLGPDEPRYAEVAREMFASGDWITPRLGGLHWFEKPALTYWLIAAGFEIWGVSEWAARIFIAVTAASTAFLLYWFGGKVKSARYGYLSASVLLSSGLWIGFGRAATFDIPLAAAFALALLTFYLWDQSHSAATRPADKWWYFCCLALGLAVLAKGLVGIILPAGIIGLYLLLTRRLLNLLRRPGLLFNGAILFLAVTSVWYGPMFVRHGSEFWHEFFVAHHFQRYLTNKYQHPQPVYFFFVIALLGCLPWSMHLVTAAQGSLRRRRKVGRVSATSLDGSLLLLLWIWIVLPIVFFSFSGSKLPGYILPIFPAIALVLGNEPDKLWSAGVSRQFRWVSVSNGLMLLMLGAYILRKGVSEIGASERESLLAALVVFSVAAAYLALMCLRREKAATLFLPTGMLVIVVAVSQLLFAGLGRQESMRDLSQIAVQLAKPGERLVFYINTEQSMNFYAPELPLRDEKAAMLTPMKPEEIARIMTRHQLPDLLVISLVRWSHEITESGLFNYVQLARQERANRHRDGLDDLVLMRIQLRAAGD